MKTELTNHQEIINIQLQVEKNKGHGSARKDKSGPNP